METASAYRIETWESKDGWRWRIVAANSRILAWSEEYDSKRNMLKTLARLNRPRGPMPVVEK